MIHLESSLFTFSLSPYLLNLYLSNHRWKLWVIVNIYLPLTVCIQSPHSAHPSSVLSLTFNFFLHLHLQSHSLELLHNLGAVVSFAPNAPQAFLSWPLMTSFFPTENTLPYIHLSVQVQSLPRFSSNVSGTRNLSSIMLHNSKSKAQIYRLWQLKIQTHYACFLNWRKQRNLRYSKHEVIFN